MHNVTVGLSGEMRMVVNAGNTVSFLGIEDAKVLGTPYLILYLEMTSRDVVKGHLEAGYDTVATHVDVRHLAASPMGMPLRFVSEVIRVDDRRFRFRVEAYDELEKIADGTHERAVIHVERFAARVQSKVKR